MNFKMINLPSVVVTIFSEKFGHPHCQRENTINARRHTF